MLEHLKWLGKRDEVEFEKHKFRGQMAGKAWKYSQNVDALIRVRIVIFIAPIIFFVSFLFNCIFQGVFSVDLLIERIFLGFILILAGLIFNKSRKIAIVLACIPVLFILYIYIFLLDFLDQRSIGTYGAILLLILSGIYHDYKLKILKKELEENLRQTELKEK